ncbi:uncharacterized protein DEA37_0005031, partial [Paragonimus westermani]
MSLAAFVPSIFIGRFTLLIRFAKFYSRLLHVSVKDWGCITTEAKNLVDRLLTRNPYTRITAEEALRHPWLQEPHRLFFDSFSVRGSRSCDNNLADKRYGELHMS